MHKILVPVIALSLCFVAGCDERDSMAVVPDREGHAGGSDANQGSGPGLTKVARADESYYTVADGDTITSIAKKFNTTRERIIKRNDIQELNELKPGTNLIVPKVGVPRK